MNPLEDSGDLLRAELLEERQSLWRLHLGQDLARRVRIVGGQDLKDLELIGSSQSVQKKSDVFGTDFAQKLGDVGPRSALDELAQSVGEHLRSSRLRTLGLHERGMVARC